MIVVDASGYEYRLEDPWDQDFELVLAYLKPWGNDRMHWRQEAKLKAAQKAAALLQLRALGLEPVTPCTIVLHRVKHRGKLDDDNVPGCMKYVRDCIAVQWMGLKSDNVPGLKFLYGQQTTTRPRFQAARVTIFQHTWGDPAAERETD